MKKIAPSLVFLCIVLLYSCGHKQQCDTVKLEDFDEVMQVSEAQIRNGKSIPVATRYNYSCMFYNGIPINGSAVPSGSGDNFQIMIKDETLRIQNNDSFQVVFFDKDWALTNKLNRHLVNLKIEGTKPPACDSVYRILYRGIGGNLDKLTDDLNKVTVIKLFDETLQGKIHDYINSLSSAQRTSMDSLCLRDFFVLDMIDTSKQYGFVTNEYELKPDLKEYLNGIAQAIFIKINEKGWKQQFSIKIDGYADQRVYKGDTAVQRSLMGIDTIGIKSIYNRNCYKDLYVDYDNPDTTLLQLTHITDNCSLSIARGFVAAAYLQQQLKKLHITVPVYYRGGNVSFGKDVDKHRKVDVFVERVAASTAPAKPRQQVIPAGKN